MKVYVQVVDTNTGVYQTGMIDEPVKKGLEVANALAHFGVNHGLIDWNKTVIDKTSMMIGTVSDTTKVVSVIVI